MADILPRELDPAESVPADAAFIIDNGVSVLKATPAQLADAGRPVADQSEAEAGADNAKAMTPLRTKQAVEARAITVPEGEPISVLPPAVDRVGGKALGFDEVTGEPAVFSKSELVGPTGPADNTYDDLAEFKAQDITNKAARFVGSPDVTDGSFNWTLGDYTGQADNENIIKADSTDLSIGAWVRQEASQIQDAARSTLLAAASGADLVGFQQSGVSTRVRTIGEKAAERVSLLDFAGVDPTGATDSSAGIQNALDAGGEIVVPPGEYLIESGVTASVAGTRLLLDSSAVMVYTSATLTPLTLNAERCQVVGGTIEAPAVFDGTNVTPTYAVVRINADGCSVSGTTILNVPKVGVWFKDCNNGRVVDCFIDGGTAEGFFTGTNTAHFGLYIDPSGTGSQGNFVVSANIIKQCVQGAFSGNTGATSYEQSATITGNVFELCWNHGIYAGGLARGYTVSGNAFNACQVPIALTGYNHVVDGNALIIQTTGTGDPEDNEITGISLRDPYGCVVSNNTIKGEGTANSSVIALDDNSGVAGANSIENNIVTGNVIEITNTTVASVALIRLSASSSLIRNNIVSDNTIKGPIRANNGLISLQASASSASDGNSITGNTVVITGAGGTGFGILLSNILDSEVVNNIVKLEYDAGSAVTLYGIVLGSCTRIFCGTNIIRCSASWGANVAFRGIQEATAGSGNELFMNKITLDPTKLAGSADFLVLSTSGIRVEHAGAGDPTGNVISGVGGLWRRTDGGGTSTLYVKEVGTSTSGWVAK